MAGLSAAIYRLACSIFNDGFWKLDDLEGLALDSSGVDLCHHPAVARWSGEIEAEAVEKLVRFRVKGDRVVDERSVGSVKSALMAAHPVLADAAAIRQVKLDGGLNVEGLEASADGAPAGSGCAALCSTGGRSWPASTIRPGSSTPARRHEIAERLETLDLGGQDSQHVPRAQPGRLFAGFRSRRFLPRRRSVCGSGAAMRIPPRPASS